MPKAKNKPVTTGVTAISEDDIKILKIIKDHRKDIFESESRTMGMETWYRDFVEYQKYYDDYTAEDRFRAADIYNKLNYMFSKLMYETNLMKGLQ